MPESESFRSPGHLRLARLATAAAAFIGLTLSSLAKPHPDSTASTSERQEGLHYLDDEREGLAHDLIGFVQDLRASGDYERAAEAADHVYRYRSLFQPEDWWQVVMARHFRDSIRNVASLDEQERTVLAEADRAWSQFSDLYSKGRYAEAAEVVLASYRSRNEITPDDHYYIGSDLNNAAIALAKAGDLERAERLYRLALERFRASIGERHPRTAWVYQNLAVLLRAKGEHYDALSFYREAHDISLRTMRSDSRLIPQSLNGIGASLFDLRRLDQAAAAFERAREALEMSGLHRDPFYAVVLSNLSEIARETGDLSRALGLQKSALRLREETLDEHHAALATSHELLGDLHHLLEEPEQAEAAYRRSIALLSDPESFDPDNAPLVRARTKLATLQRRLGRFGEAEHLYDEAFSSAERLRSRVIGDERSRASYAEALDISSLAADFATLLLRLGRYDEAFSILERGRGRALLDLLARDEHDLLEEARLSGERGVVERLENALRAEQEARGAAAAAEARVPVLRQERQIVENDSTLSERMRTDRLAALDGRIAAAVDAVKRQRSSLAEASAGVLAKLRDLFPAAEPMDSGEILAALEPGELVVTFIWTDREVAALTAGEAGVVGGVVAEGETELAALREQVRALRSALTDQSGAAFDESAAAALLTDLLPNDLIARASNAERLIFLPDGPLHGVPLEPLLRRNDNLAHVPVVYAASATMYLDRKRAAQAQRAVSATPARLAVVGDPIFDRMSDEASVFPDAGVFITSVADGSNAAKADLRRGDVIRSYAGATTNDLQSLVDAIGRVNQTVETHDRDPSTRDVLVSIWRDGETLEIPLAPGPMGINLSQIPPDEILRSMSVFDLNLEAAEADATALDQVRLYGGTLPRLPGTAREARSIASAAERAGAQAVLLLHTEATIGNIEEAAAGARYLHFATHGLMGSSARPYEASLALTQPQTPTPGDTGFLRLDDLVRSWRGTLSQCVLVTLSACDTQRGIQRGDAMMSLPWGFFYAGAPTVVASLWKVDDAATSLLMTRFYENLLGVHEQPRTVHARSFAPGEPLPTLFALDEAKDWLRNIEETEVRRLLSLDRMPTAEATDSAQQSDTGVRSDGRGSIVSRPASTAHLKNDQPRPFAHPRHWAAFVVLGAGR